jgi:hypothetical protein
LIRKLMIDPFRRAMSDRGTALSVVIVAAALAIAVSGVLVVVDQRGARHEPASANASLGGLTAAVGTAAWAMADHVMPVPGGDGQGGGQPGYQMPPQMMPGMPTGDDVRLSVPLTLENTSGAARRFDLATEFLLRGGREAEPRTPQADTFGELNRLGPGSAVNGVLYFDAEAPAANDPPLYLEWSRDGETARITVSLDATHHD